MPRFIHAVFLGVDSDDQSARFAGLFAIAEFSSSSERAMELLFSNQELMNTWISLLNSPKTELKAAVLHSVAKVIDSGVRPAAATEGTVFSAVGATAEEAKNAPPVQDSDSIRSKKMVLLSMVGRTRKISTLAYLLECVKQPIPEVKHAAYDVRILVIFG